MSPAAKGIFISHSSKDIDLALEITDLIEQHIGKDTYWIDYFDLDAGTELVTSISQAIAGAEWFVLLATNSSMASRWVQFEAKLATLLSIEREGFSIITLKGDECEFPRDLDLLLRSRKYIDLTARRELGLDEFIRALQSDPLLAKRELDVFVDRGEDLDVLELMVPSHTTVQIIGIPGIGKTELIKRAARDRFRRSLIKIDIQLGHDSAMLCRQVLSLLGVPQPPSDSHDLVGETTQQLASALSQRTMLLLNHAENSVEDDGTLRPYMREFLERLSALEPRFPVFLATTRKIELSGVLAGRSLMHRVNGLTADFMMLAIRKWLTSIDSSKSSLSQNELEEIVAALEGYPIAAKLIAGFLAFESAATLKSPRKFARLQRTIAENIVGSYAAHLDDLDRRILYSASIMQGPITRRYLWAVGTIRSHGKERVEDSISKLLQMMLLEQDVDSLRVHSIVGAYFLEQSRKENTFREIASDLADVALGDVLDLLEKLDRLSNESISSPVFSSKYINLGTQLIRVAVPAHRLLLATEQRGKLEKIPYQFNGHIREMVFIAYQESRDYKACIDYARTWLSIEPDDSEIQLYLARAYRQMEAYDRATPVLNEILRSAQPSPRLKARILREFGLMSYQKGELSDAIEAFRKGHTRSVQGRLDYPQNAVDLARALLARASNYWDDDSRAKADYCEAADILTELEASGSLDERDYFGLYIDAQLHCGRISNTEAIAELEEALVVQPDNERIHHRLAEILSDNSESLDKALEHANKSCSLGFGRAHLTVADILCRKGMYEPAIQNATKFTPSMQRDAIVRDVILSRAMIGLSQFERARKILSTHSQTSNSYLNYALANVEISALQNAIYRQDYSEARSLLAAAEITLRTADEESFKESPSARLHSQLDEAKRML